MIVHVTCIGFFCTCILSFLLYLYIRLKENQPKMCSKGNNLKNLLYTRLSYIHVKFNKFHQGKNSFLLFVFELGIYFKMAYLVSKLWLISVIKVIYSKTVSD